MSGIDDVAYEVMKTKARQLSNDVDMARDGALKAIARHRLEEHFALITGEGAPRAPATLLPDVDFLAWPLGEPNATAA